MASINLFNEWLVFSLILLAIWLVIFLFKKNVRKEMFFVSLFTMPLGLTEPLFVPEYWNPPSLFNLAATTGFDVESLIFSFAIGGIASVLYEMFFRVKHRKMSKHEMYGKGHRFHLVAIVSPIIIFAILYFFSFPNPIYSASIAMFIGSFAALLCRPDLKKKVLGGGLLFLVLYFISFVILNLIYPGFIESTWNLSAISGILFFGVPLEELLFAFPLGMLWSSIYEHVLGYKLKNN